MQIFTDDQLHLIRKGQMHQTVLRSQINEALFNNPFNENYIISSLPGMGKSYETQAAIATMQNPPLLVEGSSSPTAFMIDYATAKYLSKGSRLTVVQDDCDMMFEDKNINTTKKMFDSTRAFKYNKNWRLLSSMCTDLQMEALASFSSDDKAGLSIPTDDTTFIILTNRYLHTVNDVNNLEEGSKKHSLATDLYSIRRRVEYKAIEMNDLELWGYVANVVLNEKICEKFNSNITDPEKHQMLTWMFSNWNKVTERNLSLAEKMTKDMIRYPQMYLNIWEQNYLQVK